MKISLKKAADLVGGKIYGDENIEINNVAKIEDAKKGDLTFLYLPAYKKYLDQTKASAVLINNKFEKTRKDLTYIEVDNPSFALQKIVIKYFKPELQLSGIDKSAQIHPSAKIGKNAAIGMNVVISENCHIGDNVKIYHNTVLMENVTVGNNTILFPNISVRENCEIGSRVIIHSGTVIGSDGFGYSTDDKGKYNKVPQIGNVIIEDDVELGSNVSVDRAAMGSTIIKKGCKIDNLVQIAHNVIVGENTAISAQSGISGSTKIGKNCIFGGQVGIVGHIEIADGVLIGAQSGIAKAIPKGGKYFGSPAKDISTALRLETHIKNLPSYSERIRNLEKKIDELEEKLNENRKG